MKFQVGDKVKFLNERGGGIVSKIISSSMVNVAIEDGFEIPTMTSDIIKIGGSDEPAGSYFDEDYNVKMPTQQQEQTSRSAPKPEEAPSYEYDRVTDLGHYPTNHKYPKGIYLAYVPEQQNLLISGPIDIYLINYTDYDILFSMFLKEPKGIYSGIDYDAVPAHSKIMIDTVEHEDIGYWSEGILQVLFHSDDNERVLDPASTRFKLKPQKFMKEDNYKPSIFLIEKAFLMSIADPSKQQAVAESEIEMKYKEETPKLGEGKEIKPNTLIDKHAKSPRTAEVDLHISALMDEYEHLSNGEILNIQINYFKRALESAMENYFYKVIFIHGIGNGTLKNAITDKLKEYGEDLDIRNAPFADYGYGAIEVLIRENM
ncbi:MAG: DUF2027 domain-containing protein [Bacteroidales bacterium]|nr:DUF2027 domain-containing protein [Bacteroidales bacterium]